MMKQQPCASKLHLSNLCRWLIGLGIFKLAFFGAWAADLPLPYFADERKTEASHSAESADKIASAPAPAQESSHSAGVSPALAPHLPEPLPAKDAALSSPVVAVRSAAPLPSLPALPPPWSKGAKAENAGDVFEMSFAGGVDTGSPLQRFDKEEEDGSWWNEIIKLTKLPVPALGVRRTAHAAVMDTPPPPPHSAASSAVSPFAPPEQAQAQAQSRMTGTPSGGAPAGTSAAAGSSHTAPLPLRPQGAASAQAAASVQDKANAGLVAPPVPSAKPFVPPDSPDRKQQDLVRREQEVLMLKQQMESRLQELQYTEKKVKGMLEEAHGVQDQKLKHLISSYTNMKAKQAAQALESLDERLAVKILAGMNPKQAGEVLTYTDPKVVAKLTELLARMQLSDE